MEVRKELLHNLDRYKNFLPQVAGRGMIAEGRSFWKEKGTSGQVAPDEADNLLERAGENQQADGHRKSLEVSRDKPVYIACYMEICPKEKGKEELKDMAQEIQEGNFLYRN